MIFGFKILKINELASPPGTLCKYGLNLLIRASNIKLRMTMDKIVLHPTSTAQWHALVNEAQDLCQFLLNEEVESYLVFLLMRFSERPEMAKSVLALEFIEGLKRIGEQRHDKLRDIGDKCLLFSGFFPEHAERKRVSTSYFIDLGQSAYSLLADGFHQTAELFNSLSHSFEALMGILKAMRLLARVNDHLIEKKFSLAVESNEITIPINVEGSQIH